MLTDFSNGGSGNPTSKLYSHMVNLAEVSSLPMDVIHCDVDDVILASEKTLGVPTAIISPPTIHGVGGPR